MRVAFLVFVCFVLYFVLCVIFILFVLFYLFCFIWRPFSPKNKIPPAGALLSTVTAPCLLSTKVQSEDACSPLWHISSQALWCQERHGGRGWEGTHGPRSCTVCLPSPCGIFCFIQMVFVPDPLFTRSSLLATCPPGLSQTHSIPILHLSVWNTSCVQCPGSVPCPGGK